MKVKIDIAEKYADVIKKTKADIMQLEAGTWFVMREFLEKYRVQKDDWMDVNYEVFKLIRRQVTTPTEFIGACICDLPFNIPRIKQKGLKSISLELDHFPYQSEERIARLEGENVVISYYGEQRLFGGVPNSTSEMAQEEFLKKLSDLHIEKWEKEYFNSDILDGEQWELTIDYTYKRVKIYGSNDYPENFDELRKLLGFEESEEEK